MVVVANGCSKSPPPSPPPEEKSRSAFVRVDIGIRSRTEREEHRFKRGEEGKHVERRLILLVRFDRRRMIEQIDPFEGIETSYCYLFAK